MEDKYSKINKKIKKACKQLPSYNSSDVKDRNPNTVEDDVNKHMLVDLKHGLSYCRHGKVGTTTFLYHFSHLTGKLSSKLRDKIENQDQQAYVAMHAAIPNKF